MRRLHEISPISSTRVSGGRLNFTEWANEYLNGNPDFQSYQQRYWNALYIQQARQVYAAAGDLATQTEPTFMVEGVEFRRPALRDEARQIASVLGRMHRSVGRFQSAMVRPDDGVAVTIDERDWRLLRHHLSYGALEHYFGHEGTRPTFMGYPLSITPYTGNPLMAGW